MRLQKKKFFLQAETLNKPIVSAYLPSIIAGTIKSCVVINNMLYQGINIDCSVITTEQIAVILPPISIMYYSLPLRMVVTLHQQNRNNPNPIKTSFCNLFPLKTNLPDLKTNELPFNLPKPFYWNYPNHVFQIKQTAYENPTLLTC